MKIIKSTIEQHSIVAKDYFDITVILIVLHYAVILIERNIKETFSAQIHTRNHRFVPA